MSCPRPKLDTGTRRIEEQELRLERIVYIESDPADAKKTAEELAE